MIVEKQGVSHNHIVYIFLMALNEINPMGVNFAGLKGMDHQDAFAALNQFIQTTQNQTQVSGNGYGDFKSFHRLEDLNGLTYVTSVVYYGMLKKIMYPINGEMGLPAVATDVITMETVSRQMRNFMPLATPALGTTMVGRMMDTLSRSQAKKYAISFHVEGEFYDAEKKATKDIVMSLAEIAGNTALLMASGAFFTILTGSMLPTITNYGDNEDQIIRQLMDVRDATASVHKLRAGAVKLIQTARIRLQEGPSKVTPTVALWPYGQMSLLTTHDPQMRDQRLGGEMGPRRMLDGVHVNDNSGKFEEGGSHSGPSTVFKIQGVEMWESPAIAPNGEVATIPGQRVVYTGEFYWCNSPMDAYYGEGPNTLPFWYLFSVEQDGYVIVSFEDFFMNCGRFKRAPLPAGGSEEDYNSDPRTYLWVVDNGSEGGNEQVSEAIQILKLKMINDDDCDPFLQLDGGGNVITRAWCSAERDATGYIDDITKAAKSDQAKKDAFAGREVGLTMKEWSELVDFIGMKPSIASGMGDIPVFRGGKDFGVTYHSTTRFNASRDIGIDDIVFRTDLRVGWHLRDPTRTVTMSNCVYVNRGGMLLPGNNVNIMTVEDANTLGENNFMFSRYDDASMYSVCIPNPKIQWRKTSLTTTTRDTSRVVMNIRGHVAMGGVRKNGEHYVGSGFYSQLYHWHKCDDMQTMGNNDFPITSWCFRGGVTYPTKSGPRHEKTHSHHGPEGNGTRGVRMFGLDVNPVLIE